MPALPVSKSSGEDLGEICASSPWFINAALALHRQGAKPLCSSLQAGQAPHPADDRHGLEQGRRCCAPSDGDAQAAEELSCLQTQLIGQGPQDVFQACSVPRCYRLQALLGHLKGVYTPRKVDTLLDQVVWIVLRQIHKEEGRQLRGPPPGS